MLLQVTHDTHYSYQPAVETAQHVAYMQPCTHAGQTLLDHKLSVTPQPQLQRVRCVTARCFLVADTP